MRCFVLYFEELKTQETVNMCLYVCQCHVHVSDSPREAFWLFVKTENESCFCVDVSYTLKLNLTAYFDHSLAVRTCGLFVESKI